MTQEENNSQFVNKLCMAPKIKYLEISEELLREIREPRLSLDSGNYLFNEEYSPTLESFNLNKNVVYERVVDPEDPENYEYRPLISILREKASVNSIFLYN